MRMGTWTFSRRPSDKSGSCHVVRIDLLGFSPRRIRPGLVLQLSAFRHVSGMSFASLPFPHVQDCSTSVAVPLEAFAAVLVAEHFHVFAR